MSDEGNGHKDTIDPDSLSEREKIVKILEALRLPRGHYIVGGSGMMVLQNIPRSRPVNDLDIFCSTAVWFQLYESTEGGLIWGLFVPDPQDERRRCDPPYLYVELLGIEINIFFTWRYREGPSEDSLNATGTGNINIAESIRCAEFSEDGWPLLSAERLLSWKQEVKRAKDVADIELLEEFISSRKE